MTVSMPRSLVVAGQQSAAGDAATIHCRAAAAAAAVVDRDIVAATEVAE
jgi:hypothetical protein